MENRPPLSGHRPHPPQRAASGGTYALSQPTLQRQPPALSRLSNVRSASQPTNLVDLNSDGIKSERSNAAAFLGNKEQVVTSPGVIKLEHEDGEPPAKRAKLSGDGFRAGRNGMGGEETNQASKVNRGSPLPNLPKTKTSTKRFAGSRRYRVGVDPATRKAQNLEPPAIATRVPLPKKAADFSPWNGNHPEDQLNENVIKTGFFDKVQSTNQQECNSAKSTIWPNLSQKNHPGLSLLSHVFTAVLEKRQSVGKCIAPSTFKPPPRVTVTDTKREAWLRDLANLDIPLRKQSRTIPHGIRGKLLMDQCMSKAIPLQRAVWLAKCVGANELRAFKRKGVNSTTAAGNESKWIREWTVSIEQFLESVIAICGQEDWERKMTYAIKLATAFYSEGLLDTDHFLDWMVASLAEATPDRLPIWIVLVQICWKDITMYGKRGRKFAETVLEHLHQLTEADQESYASLKLRLQKLIAILAASNRGCLIIPRTWERYKYLLMPKTNSCAKDTPAENIAKRNECLAAPLSKNAANTRSGLLNLFTELDSLHLDLDIQRLTNKALTLVGNVFKLVSGLLDWASTPYRVGTSRIYLAAAIIAQLNKTGEDTDAAVLQHLGNKHDIAEPAATNVHRVVVELVRLQAFSTGRYLQWLITGGLLSVSEEATFATDLIAALPTLSLPLHLFNTKKTVMARLGHPTDENLVMLNMLNDIVDAIETSLTDRVGPVEIPADLTVHAKMDICRQVCASALTMVKDTGIGVEGFGLVRDLTIRVGDFASLANLTNGMLNSDNLTLLATVADTINCFAETFTALGVFSRLVDGLSEQYIHLRSQQPLERTFIVALIRLARRIHEKAGLVTLLTEDLALSEQQSSMAVCSPASDSLIGMHATSLDSDDDIDAVFSSGNTMDEQLMQRVFTRIVHRASKNPQASLGPTSRTCGWLEQLRAVDQSGVFDRITQGYVRSLIKVAHEQHFTPGIISYLVSAGCFTLDALADMTREADSSSIARDVLPMFLFAFVAGTELSNAERHRYIVQQERCQVEHADLLIKLVRMSCDTPDFATENPEIIRFFIRCVQDRPGSVRRIFEDGKSSQIRRLNAGRMIMAALQCEITADHDVEIDMQSLVGIAEPLSIRFCTGALEYFKGSPGFTSADEVALSDAILEAFRVDSEVWPQLLEFAGPVVNRTIHEWVQHELLSMAFNTDEMEAQIAEEEGMSRYLDLLAVTSQQAKSSEDTSIISTITEKLKDLEKQMSAADQSGAGNNANVHTWMHQLRVILNLCVMHVHGSPNENDTSKQSKANLLVVFCNLLMHPKLQTHTNVVEYLFDLASVLSDNLPDASQLLLKLQANVKFLTDARLTFIVGLKSSAVDAWLALASQAHPSGSQQQKALNKYSSQQQQNVVGRPLPTSNSTPQQHQRIVSQGGPGMLRHDGRAAAEVKIAPFSLRRWEMMPDATPVVGENDVSLSLTLFGARKV